MIWDRPESSARIEKNYLSEIAQMRRLLAKDQEVIIDLRAKLAEAETKLEQMAGTLVDK